MHVLFPKITDIAYPCLCNIQMDAVSTPWSHDNASLLVCATQLEPLSFIQYLQSHILCQLIVDAVEGDCRFTCFFFLDILVTAAPNVLLHFQSCHRCYL